MMPSYDDAVRTIVDLPEEQIKALAEICRRQGISRAEAVRRAVAEYANHHTAVKADQAFGLWRRRGVDGLAYQRRLRREW
jgi:hypothetical protein